MYQNERIGPDGNACEGQVVINHPQLLWFGCHSAIAIIGGILTFSLNALLVFVCFTAISLCLGHSLGMHRRFIHRAYDCPKWLEYLFVHLGVIVGLAGPFGMLRTHDMRDWAQRQSHCHDFYAHARPMAEDAWWQLCCRLDLKQAPTFSIEAEYRDDPVYQWMEKYWMWQQLPWALLLFAMGGFSYVIWGICMRVCVSITGHWLIGYFAHNRGQRHWHVEGAAVQGHNVAFCGLITMGECWHNNHHAFPGSALLGIQKHQSDPGWWVLLGLQRLGLVWDIKTHLDLPPREELHTLSR